MAEAAGLVMGGIALVGLISTCVEIAEYLESAKNLAADFKMALTKVNLIKQRLRAWGAAIPLDMPPDPRSNHTIAHTDCGALIRETLLRIKSLLDKTTRISRRHRLRSSTHRRDLSSPSASSLSSEKPHYLSYSVSSSISLPSSSEASFGVPHPRLPQLLSSFSLKVIWVFQDRKRFDNIIVQLDFLLSNLERISETLQSRHKMDHNVGPARSPVAVEDKETQEESNYGCTDSGEEAERAPEDGPAVMVISRSSKKPHHWHYISQNEAGILELGKKNEQEDLPSGGADPPGRCRSSSQDGGRCEVVQEKGSHSFESCKSHEGSNLLQGNVGDVPKDLTGHSFKHCDSHGQSLHISGSINSSVVTEILKNRAAMKDEKEIVKNAADASITPRTPPS